MFDTIPTKKWAREYETIYILRPQVEPADAEKIASRINEVLQRLGGTLTKVDNWGKRRLAYPIAKNTRGIFVYVKYVGFNDVVAELERNLRQFDAVVRFQTVLVNDLVDPGTVTVDAEEVKFLPIEQGAEEEEEENLEARLGMIDMPRQRRHEEFDPDAVDLDADDFPVQNDLDDEEGT